LSNFLQAAVIILLRTAETNIDSVPEELGYGFGLQIFTEAMSNCSLQEACAFLWAARLWNWQVP
jgi:hypothetical protein